MVSDAVTGIRMKLDLETEGKCQRDELRSLSRDPDLVPT